MVDVTDADQMAAADYMGSLTAPGDWPTLPEAFARHREAARREGMEEAARIAETETPHCRDHHCDCGGELAAQTIREASQ